MSGEVCCDSQPSCWVDVHGSSRTWQMLVAVGEHAGCLSIDRGTVTNGPCNLQSCCVFQHMYNHPVSVTNSCEMPMLSSAAEPEALLGLLLLAREHVVEPAVAACLQRLLGQVRTCERVWDAVVCCARPAGPLAEMLLLRMCCY